MPNPELQKWQAAFIQPSAIEVSSPELGKIEVVIHGQSNDSSYRLFVVGPNEYELQSELSESEGGATVMPYAQKHRLVLEGVDTSQPVQIRTFFGTEVHSLT